MGLKPLINVQTTKPFTEVNGNKKIITIKYVVVLLPSVLTDGLNNGLIFLALAPLKQRRNL